VTRPENSAVTAADLDVSEIGAGPSVLLIHGSVVDATRTWRHQLALGEQWTLRMPNRPGFGASPPLERGDFELEAPLFAPLLGDGSHLVGHSYGAVIALLVAAARPQAVWSLTVSEPGALGVARGDPVVDTLIAEGEELYRRGHQLDPHEFLLSFRAGLHSAHETPEQLPDWLERGARLVMAERPPWEVELPLDALAATSFPKLVISGGHSSAFDTVCDTIAERTGAQRSVVAGRAHTIPSTGEPYNRCVHGFLSAAQAARGLGPAE